MLDVTIEVDDPAIGSSPDDSVSLSINVLDVNEPPALDVSQTVTSLNELVDTSAAIKIADVGIIDDAAGTNVLSLTGTDAVLFELVGGELFLRSGVSLDFETQPQLHVTIELDDAGLGSGIEDSVDLTIDVLDGNEAPSFTLTQVLFSLPENDGGVAMVKIADLAITDDALGTNLFSISGDDALLLRWWRMHCICGMGLCSISSRTAC
ncbi:MAG: hypothetical protein R3C18_12645 [Planctomycetaceae bacterium]